MTDYEILEHTADAKFRAYGSTKEEAFANAVKGMTAIVTEPEKVERTKQFPINIQGNDDKQLLFNMLDQILFLIDTEHFLPAAAENLRIEGNALQATLVGDDVKKYGGNLKAVTYSDMLVEQQDDQWVLQVVIDI